jgi:hypothetical protein
MRFVRSLQTSPAHGFRCDGPAAHAARLVRQTAQGRRQTCLFFTAQLVHNLGAHNILVLSNVSHFQRLVQCFWLTCPGQLVSLAVYAIRLLPQGGTDRCFDVKIWLGEIFQIKLQEASSTLLSFNLHVDHWHCILCWTMHWRCPLMLPLEAYLQCAHGIVDHLFLCLRRYA